MSSDASRRWLDGSGIWSCRIKLPQQQHDHPEHPHHIPPMMAPSRPHAMSNSHSLEPTSPSSRRTGKIQEALQSMANLNNSMESMDMPTDPDAQATVTDFLDFTEYLPADMFRSLTLIGNLDSTHAKASNNVHEHTKVYGSLPQAAADEPLDPVKLRALISQDLHEALSARTLSHAEAIRMADNVERHYNRVNNILAKLQHTQDNYPASREPSPEVQKVKSPNRPKITLRLDGTRVQQDNGRPKVRKHRAPRITVPGEVLAPYELDYDSYGTETSDYDTDEEPLTPRATPGAMMGAASHKIKLKINKSSSSSRKDKAPKPPRAPRPPGVMGTNVHSAVAGISTSNALAKLTPPPATAINGDKDLPWLQLNAYELAILRKRMKKNAIWSPSDTMIARELASRGRGIEAYRTAKATAEAAGRPFDESHEPPQLRGETVHAEGAISVEAVKRDEPQISNRGMVLNQAKKLKKENEAKELAKLAAEEAEQSAVKMAEAAKAMKGLFAKSPSKDEKDKKQLLKTPSKSKKRKRDSPGPEGETEKPVITPADTPKPTSAEPPVKKSKKETPVPVPHPLKHTPPILPIEPTPSVASDLSQILTPIEGPTETHVFPPMPISPKKSSTPILPPVRQTRRAAVKEEAMKLESTPITVNARRRRSSATTPSEPATPIFPAQIVPQVAEPLPPKRPTSSRSKAATEEAATPTTMAFNDRPRRTSTARNTPAPEPRQPSKRTKRPAPGVLTGGSEGSAAVSVGRRKGPTRKKAGVRKEKKDEREGSAVQETWQEVDDEGNLIDPAEPRYCLCNRVSFGTMIGCEDNNCNKEWFHLECVGLEAIPPRTTKWYCPECRITLGIGEKGEVSARGRKQ